MNKVAEHQSVLAMDAEGPLRIGTRFGKFSITKRIGRGGYASVYQAFDTVMQRDVAIKVLHRAGGVSADMLRRGVAEAQLLSQVQDANVVRVHDANVTDGGLLYLVMELLVGQTLFQILRHYRRLAIEEAYGIAMQIADGVEAAHKLGAIHRDLKPENVFIVKGNVVKVLDFGIAKFIHAAHGNTTKPDGLQGTPLYMSPEHIGGMNVTPRSDIYALGCILYEMINGRHPCLLRDPNPAPLSLAWMQVNEIPPPLDKIAPHCPKHLARIVGKALAKRPTDRQSNMSALRDALSASRLRYLDETGGGEQRGRTRDLADAGTAVPRHAPSPRSEAAKPIATTIFGIGASPSPPPLSRSPTASRVCESASSSSSPSTRRTEHASSTRMPSVQEQASPISHLNLVEACGRSLTDELPSPPTSSSIPPRKGIRAVPASWLVVVPLACLAGCVVSMSVMDSYLTSRRAVAAHVLKAAEATPTPPLPLARLATEAEVTNQNQTLAGPTPLPSVAKVQEIRPQPSSSASAAAAVPTPPLTKPKTTSSVKPRPKKLDPSAARLKALEDLLMKSDTHHR